MLNPIVRFQVLIFQQWGEHIKIYKSNSEVPSSNIHNSKHINQIPSSEEEGTPEVRSWKTAQCRRARQALVEASRCGASVCRTLLWKTARRRRARQKRWPKPVMGKQARVGGGNQVGWEIETARSCLLWGKNKKKKEPLIFHVKWCTPFGLKKNKKAQKNSLVAEGVATTGLYALLDWGIWGA